MERGLFRASDGAEINDDINGACNIAKKHIGKPNSDLFKSEDGLASVVDTPRRIRKPDFVRLRWQLPHPEESVNSSFVEASSSSERTK